MKQLLTLVSAILVAQTLFAHEGHDKAPGVLTASHDGVVLEGKEINLEYTISTNEVKLYPFSHEGKELPSNKVVVSATAKLPKGKPEKLKVENRDGAFLILVDFKNSHRVEVNVSTEANGKKDVFKFQVEK